MCVIVALAVTGTDDLANEIGHVHFDVQLEKVNKRVKLDVANQLSVVVLGEDRRDNIHKAVRQRHHANEQDL